MLTLFALPKPFEGHNGLIQRNALLSWKALGDEVEVILLGDDLGVAEVAREFGWKHLPDIARSEKGTPLVNDIFRKGEAAAASDTVCYINSDIILPPAFPFAAKMVHEHFDKYLMIGQRWDLDVDEPLDFADPDWYMKLQSRTVTQGVLHRHTGVDYFLFRKGLYSSIPPFAIGRFVWDNWLVAEARKQDAAVIDATDAVFIVHQNHDYAHAGGAAEAWKGAERQQNARLGNMTDSSAGYIQTAATWRLLPWRFVPVARGKFPVAVEDPGRNVEMELTRATALVEKGKPEESLQALAGISGKAAHLAVFHSIRGLALARLGQREQAIEACRRSLRIDPGAKEARHLVGLLGGDASTAWAPDSAKTPPGAEENSRPFEQTGAAGMSLTEKPTSRQPRERSKIPADEKTDRSPNVVRFSFHQWMELLTKSLLLDDRDFNNKRILVAVPGIAVDQALIPANATVSVFNPGESEGNKKSRVSGPFADEAKITLPYPDRSFDVVLMIDSSEFSDSPARLAAEAARVLEPDGLLIFSAIVATTEDSPWNLLAASSFERFFWVELEEHREWSNETAITALQPFAHERPAPSRRALLLCKLRCSAEAWTAPEPVPPLEVDGAIFAVAHGDLARKPGEREAITKLTDKGMERIAKGATINGLNDIREAVRRMYTDLAIPG